MSALRKSASLSSSDIDHARNGHDDVANCVAGVAAVLQSSSYYNWAALASGRHEGRDAALLSTKARSQLRVHSLATARESVGMHVRRRLPTSRGEPAVSRAMAVEISRGRRISPASNWRE